MTAAIARYLDGEKLLMSSIHVDGRVEGLSGYRVSLEYRIRITTVIYVSSDRDSEHKRAQTFAGP